MLCGTKLDASTVRRSTFGQNSACTAVALRLGPLDQHFYLLGGAGRTVAGAG